MKRAKFCSDSEAPLCLGYDIQGVVLAYHILRDVLHQFQFSLESDSPKDRLYVGSQLLGRTLCYTVLLPQQFADNISAQTN